jgi:hypothetical protein
MHGLLAFTCHELAGLEVEAFFRHGGGHQTVELPILEALQGGILDLQGAFGQISACFDTLARQNAV